MTTQPERGRYAAVVVTYNRAALLMDSVDALLAQSAPPDHLVIVDNASTDDTTARMAARGWLDHERISYLKCPINGGGAGGFAHGLAYCVDQGFDWIWLCDDDAIAEPGALQALQAIPPQRDNLYASAAVYERDGETWLCWPAEVDRAGQRVSERRLAALAPCEETGTLPFLGFLISAQLVREIGLPDRSFFLSADDMEYVARARARGSRSYLVAASRLRHPAPDDYVVRALGRDFFCLRLAPSRRYFYVRNKILLARRHLGARVWTQTLPGLVIRLFASLTHEPARLRQLRAYALGVMDGVCGRIVDPQKRLRL